MVILEFIVWCICLWIIIGKDSVWIILYISGILSLFILIFIINIICKVLGKLVLYYICLVRWFWLWWILKILNRKKLIIILGIIFIVYLVKC